PEPDLQAHLVMGDVAVHDLAPDLGDLEPVQVPQGLCRPVQRVPDRGLDALGRGADDLRDPVCAVSHGPSVLVLPPSSAGPGPDRAGRRDDHGIVTAMVPDAARGRSGAWRYCSSPKPDPGDDALARRA